MAVNKNQFEGYVKSDGSSPTVTTDSLFITGVIEVKEERDVSTLYIPGAFLHTKNDETILMLLRGQLAELLVKVDPKLYRKYVITSRKGVPMIYVKL